MNVIHNLIESDINNIDVKSQLKHQVQYQETKESGWIFDKISSMKIRFYKTGEIKRSKYVEFLLRTNAILKPENIDEYCFLWSILAGLHPCENSHPSRVKISIYYFMRLNFQGFDFANGIKWNDVHKLEKLNNLSINIFETNFFQDQNNWKHNLVLIEISKTNQIISLTY